MTVLVHTRTPRADDGVTFVSRDELAARAEHIVIAATATPATRHLVDHAFLSRTRTGVHLVNVARGSLVDQEALKVFLDSGHVVRATLDTVDPEPLPAGHWLHDHPRVLLSPHVAASSPLSLQEAVTRFADNYRRRRVGGRGRSSPATGAGLDDLELHAAEVEVRQGADRRRGAVRGPQVVESGEQPGAQLVGQVGRRDVDRRCHVADLEHQAEVTGGPLHDRTHLGDRPEGGPRRSRRPGDRGTRPSPLPGPR